MTNNFSDVLKQIAQTSVREADYLLGAMRHSERDAVHILAATAVANATAKRDSVSRKLCGESSAVNIETLAMLEKELVVAQETLSKIERHSPATA